MTKSDDIKRLPEKEAIVELLPGEYLPELAGLLAEAEVLLAQGDAVGHCVMILKKNGSTFLLGWACPRGAEAAFRSVLKTVHNKIGG